MDHQAIELHPDAIAEARDAREWYAKRSSVAADAFMAELDVAIDTLVIRPPGGPPTFTELAVT